MQIKDIRQHVPHWTEVYNREDIRPYSKFLGIFADHLYTHPPRRINVVGMVSPKRFVSFPRTLPIIAIGHFRVGYTAIETLGRILAPSVLETGIIPIIKPITESSFKRMDLNDPFISVFSKRGAVLYISDQE